MHCIDLRNSLAHDHDFWYICIKWWYLQVILSFIQTFFFWVVRGLKGQKTVQKSKVTKDSVCHAPYLRNHTSYDIIYGAHVWNRFFSHFFKILIFWVVRGEGEGGVKVQKWSKMTKNFICHTSYFRNYMSYYLHLWYTCLNKRRIISPGIFFSFFSKFWFSE